jgi:hypothetical protein
MQYKYKIKEAIEKSRIGTVYHKCAYCEDVVATTPECISIKRFLQELNMEGLE